MAADVVAEAGAEPLAAAREAAAAHAWAVAHELFAAAEAKAPLGAEDLELFAEAALWSTGLDEWIATLERAYARYVDDGERRRAAYVALNVAAGYHDKLKPAVASGWHARAARLLESEPESVEHGYLAGQRALIAAARGDSDQALLEARHATDLGRRFGDRNLETIGIVREGVNLVKAGQVAEGLALLDEASAAATGGELDRYCTVIVYCNLIGTCSDLADFGRASEWAETASEWCAAHEIAGMPGQCRVNRAEIMRVNGRLAEAGEEVRRACEELRAFSPRVLGQAFYESGEIELRLGRLDAAREAFDRAHELGKSPEPGQSLLLLAEGKVDAAARSIRLALADDSLAAPQRARLLPAEIEVALAAGELERARAARDELVETARAVGTDALAAQAAWAEGAVGLAEGDLDTATGRLRHALRRWQDDVNAPYEAGRVRLLLAEAYRRGGEEEAATRELRAARRTFEELGAVLAARRAAELLGVDTGERVERTFVFTDIVDSTGWAERLGDAKWRKQLRKHNELVSAAIGAAGGEVVKTTGDGFFAAFDRPSEALEAAVAVQRAADDELPFEVRIGLHAAEATSREGDYEGAGVHAAARIGALARGGEILASRTSVEGAQLPASEPRLETLKGFEEPVEVVSVDWRPA